MLDVLYNEVWGNFLGFFGVVVALGGGGVGIDDKCIIQQRLGILRGRDGAARV